MKKKSKCILITGCGGFIASSLAKEVIRRDHSVEIVTIDNLSTGFKSNIPKNVKTYIGNCFDAEIIDKVFLENQINEIIHFAGQSSGEISFDDPTYDLNTNTLSTIMLLKKASEAKVKKFMYASSMSVYGDTKNAKETAICSPKSFYGVGKLASEKYLEIYSKNFGIDVISLRLFNVYGPGQNLQNLRQGMVSIFLAQLLKSNVLKVHGSLNRFRDFVFIDDVVDLVLRLQDMENYPLRIINVGTGTKTTVKNLIGIISKQLSIDNLIIEQPKNTPGDINGIFSDNKIFSEIFGDYKFTTLDVGIRKMVKYHKDVN